MKARATRRGMISALTPLHTWLVVEKKGTRVCNVHIADVQPESCATFEMMTDRFCFFKALQTCCTTEAEGYYYARTHAMERKQALAFSRAAQTVHTQTILKTQVCARQLPICNTTSSNSKLVLAKWLASCTPQTKPPIVWNL